MTSFIGCLRALVWPRTWAGAGSARAWHGTKGVGVTKGVRAAGWYADPWGTEGERYFDGAAWGRESRPVGGVSEAATPMDAPAQPPGPTVVPPTLGSPPDTAPRPPSDAGPGAAPAAWHRDPGDSPRCGGRTAPSGRATSVARRRHGSHPPTLSASERSPGGCARAVGGWGRAGGHPRDLGRSGAVDRRPLERDHPPGRWRDPDDAGVDHELARPAQRRGRLRVAILFMLWFYRAASTGWSSGIPARRRSRMDRDAVVHHPDPQPVVAVPGRARHGAGR